jgi:hypothetical protein
MQGAIGVVPMYMRPLVYAIGIDIILNIYYNLRLEILPYNKIYISSNAKMAYKGIIIIHSDDLYL